MNIGDVVETYDGTFGILREIDSVGCCRVYDGDDVTRKWYSPGDIRADDAVRLLGALLDCVDTRDPGEAAVARVYERTLRDKYGLQRIDGAWLLVPRG